MLIDFNNCMTWSNFMKSNNLDYDVRVLMWGETLKAFDLDFIDIRVSVCTERRGKGVRCDENSTLHWHNLVLYTECPVYWNSRFQKKWSSMNKLWVVRKWTFLVCSLGVSGNRQATDIQLSETQERPKNLFCECPKSPEKWTFWCGNRRPLGFAHTTWATWT